MFRRDMKGGDLNLIRVLRHDLPGKQLQSDIHFPWQVVAIMLAAISVVETAILVQK